MIEIAHHSYNIVGLGLAVFAKNGFNYTSHTHTQGPMDDVDDDDDERSEPYDTE